MTRSSDRAANSFYGQSEVDFAKQLKQLGITDPRLAEVFTRTRERFLNGEFGSGPKPFLN